MKILLFHGHGIVSWAIRCQTRGKYSHAALMLRDGSIVEAWQGAGVRRLPELRRGWDGVDVYEPIETLSDELEERLEKIALSFLGRPYSYLGVIRFVTKRKKDSPGIFCSELVVDTFTLASWPILNAPGWAVDPDKIPWSTRIRKKEK